MTTAYRIALRLLLATAAIGAVATAIAADAAALPRYHFQVGQELVYTEHREFDFKLDWDRTLHYDSGKFSDDTSWQICVVRQNEDGKWRLAARQNSVSIDERYLGEKSISHTESKSTTVMCCDMSPTGQITNQSCPYERSLNHVLPALPSNEAELQHGWSAAEGCGETAEYQVLSQRAGDDHLAVQILRKGIQAALYGIESQGTAFFDPQRDLFDRIETSEEQTYTFNGKGHSTLQLDRVEMHGAEWCGRLASDTDTYIRWQEAYDNLRIEGRNHLKAEEIAAALDELVNSIGAAKEEARSPDWQRELGDLATKCNEGKHRIIELARNREENIGKPAPAWTANDLGGISHSQSDYRGKIVVLDFWYRGCFWCVRAMPQIEEVASYFAGQPVVVLGMNTDRNEADARFVAEKLSLNCTTICAAEAVKNFDVAIQYPTLIVIDQEGINRDVYHGCTPNLKHKLIESVERLLKEK